MKQISEVEEKPFTSSLYICSKAFLYAAVERVEGGRSNFSPSPPTYFPAYLGYFI
jgi:hypothetical protein